MNNLREGNRRATVRGPRSGDGLVELSQVAGRTVVTRCRASSPLKILTPMTNNPAAWVFSSTYGGGLLGGDSIRLNILAEPSTRCILSTQASTKIYRTTGSTSKQELTISLGENAIAICAPDPVVCFKNSSFIQEQQFSLAEGAGLVLVDWFSSGRWANGERWAFRRYQSRNEIVMQGKCIFRDCLSLDPANGAIDGPMRMGFVNCYATVVIVGAPLAAASSELLKDLAGEPARRSRSLLFSASLMENGAVLRVAGESCETVGLWVRHQLNFVTGLIGQDPWARKW